MDSLFETCSSSFEGTLKKIGYRHAVHAILWAKKNSKPSPPKPELVVLINMQLRFDGYFGFPGGFVDDELPLTDIKACKSIITKALVRELKEEVNWSETMYEIQFDTNWMVSDIWDQGKICMHVYSIQLSETQFISVEANALKSRDFGTEVMGNIRIPLMNCKDGYTQFTTFLSNKFKANSKQQLLKLMRDQKFISDDFLTQLKLQI